MNSIEDNLNKIISKNNNFNRQTNYHNNKIQKLNVRRTKFIY